MERQLIYRDKDSDHIVITGYDLGCHILEHHELFRTSNPTQPAELDAGVIHPLLQTIFQQLIFLDGQDHGRIRGALVRPLNAAIKTVRPYAEHVAEVLLQAGERKGRMDLANAYASPFTLLNLARLLGMGAEVAPDAQDLDAEKMQELLPALSVLHRWSEGLLDLTTGMFSMDALGAAIEMYDAFNRLLETRRASLAGGIAHIYASEADLKDDERTINFMALFGAGNFTTTRLISNSVAAIAESCDAPKPLETVGSWLRDEPTLHGMFTHEMLRLISPTQYVSRFATSTTEFHGVTIYAGQKVIVSLAAMNRDPKVFENPGRLDVRRRNCPKHVSFGLGAHLCPGKAIAQLEATVAFTKLFTRPGLRAQFEHGLGNGRNDTQGRRTACLSWGQS